MKTAKKFAVALAVLGAILAPLSSVKFAEAASIKVDPNSSYNTNSLSCAIGVVGSKKASEGANRLGESGSQFREVGNNTVAATVIVTGDDNCTKTLTLASWSGPWGVNSLLPIEGQHLFTKETYNLKKGTHTVSVKHNDCRFQVDMVYGNSPYAPDGWSALYPEAQKLGWVGGGNKACYPPVTPPQVCPDGTPAPQNDASKCPVTCPNGTPAPGNDTSKCPVKCPDGSTAPGNDTSKCPVHCPDGSAAPEANMDKCPKPCVEQDSNNMKNEDSNNCPVAAPVMGKGALPDVLPATGAGSIIAIFAIAAIAGSLSHRYILRRRQNV